MKKSFILALLSMFSFAQAQTTVDTIRTDITTNTTWNSGTIYLLQGNIFVKNGATLTIEPGTIIRGDKASKGTLIITKTGRIYANGTATQPIVFTSNQRAGQRTYGDWGGVVILGNATTNIPGGVGIIEGERLNEYRFKKSYSIYSKNNNSDERDFEISGYFVLDGEKKIIEMKDEITNRVN